MAHARPDRLGEELAALLAAIDAAIRRKFDDAPRPHAKRRRTQVPRHAKPSRRGGLMTALRRLFRA